MTGVVESAILYGGLDALATFLDGDVRQTDDVEISGLARADVDFDFHDVD
jgi:hypothetical protein